MWSFYQNSLPFNKKIMALKLKSSSKTTYYEKEHSN